MVGWVWGPKGLGTLQRAQGPGEPHLNLCPSAHPASARGRLQGLRAHWTLALQFPALAGSAVGRTVGTPAPARQGCPLLQEGERSQAEPEPFLLPGSQGESDRPSRTFGL